MKTVFLDRDGVINRDRPDYIKHLGEFVFLPGALEAIIRLAEAGLEVIVVTNQAAIGKGLMEEADLVRIHDYLLREVERRGGRIRAIYCCPHRPEDNCSCRKPEPGLLRRAAEELGLCLEECYLIGNRGSDIIAGKAVGCITLFVKASNAMEDPTVLSPDAVVANLSEAADWILGRERGAAGKS